MDRVELEHEAGLKWMRPECGQPSQFYDHHPERCEITRARRHKRGNRKAIDTCAYTEINAVFDALLILDRKGSRSA